MQFVKKKKNHKTAYPEASAAATFYVTIWAIVYHFWYICLRPRRVIVRRMHLITIIIMIIKREHKL